jgi:hypothetical protein
MKAERSNYLSDLPDNKGNGYRPINGLGIGESLSLQVPRDRLNQFKPWILFVVWDLKFLVNYCSSELVREPA